MGKVTELTLTKGRTIRAGEAEEWLHVEYTIKALVEDEAELDVAKAHLEGVIDGWLSSHTPKPAEKPDAVKWVQAQGTSGPYERYPAEGEKPEASEDYKRMLEDLKAHNGKLTREGYFYWVFQDGATVGRKKRGGTEPGQEPAKMVQLTIQQLEKIKAPFGDMADLLTFTVKNGTVVVTPRQFLGADNFAKIANVVRGLGGQYVSEGKNSRFELPLQK